ncbi:MAG: hypothetical protein IKD69_08325, partial [Solobacterium sp.]|nr:hypothetical protein [Solobacterium sp.]
PAGLDSGRPEKIRRPDKERKRMKQRQTAEIKAVCLSSAFMRWYNSSDIYSYYQKKEVAFC